MDRRRARHASVSAWNNSKQGFALSVIIVVFQQIENLSDIGGYARHNELMELIEESGCDIPVTVSS